MTNQILARICERIAHSPIFCTVETSLKKHNDQFYLRDYSKFNPEAYLQDISAVDWDVIFAQSNNLHEAIARSIEGGE